MGLAPAITGIGDQVRPARLFARAVAVNMRREIHFPGEILEFWEKGPTENTLLEELIEDWCALPKHTNEQSSNEWEFEIMDTERITDAVTNKTAFMKIGDLKFKGVKRDSKAGNLGVWKFVTEMI